MEPNEIWAIDTMCRAFYWSPEHAKQMFEQYEVRVMAYTTFGGVMKKLGLKTGEEWKVLVGKESIKELIEEMDEVKVQYVFGEDSKCWSRRDHRLWADYKLDDIKQMVDESGGRIIGGVSYNPFYIKESIENLERGIIEYGFKYVWAHPITFGLRPDDKKMYPLYIKAVELGVPVGIQVGQSAEALPSEPGHPMCADEVAMDFPDLTLILTHTGWPWVDEWISMIWRHPNVYGNIGMYFASDLDPAIVKFMNGRGQDKVMWASGGIGLTRSKREFLELPLKDEVKRKILRDNALRIYKLEP